MANVIQQISVDIVRGFEQKDPRWAEWASVYSQSTDLFAFWDSRTVAQPAKNDLRLLTKQRTQGVLAGERPGSGGSSTIAPFTTEDPDKPEQIVYDEDRVAVLKILRRAQKASQKTVTGLKVIGGRREKTETVMSTPKPLIDIEGMEILLETNAFFLQSVTEGFQEKFQISETFGQPVLHMFGDRQKIFQYGGLLLDTDSWQWKEKFIDNYERLLRGTKCVEQGASVVIITNSAIVRGYILNCNIQQSIDTHGYVGFNFAMFVLDRIPINQIEPSPQSQVDLSAELDQQSIFFTINDLVSKPGDVAKTLDRTNGVVELPSGFQPDTYDQQQADPATHFQTGATVNGLEPRPLKLAFPGALGLYTPPDGPFQDPVPANYLNEIIVGVLGKLGTVSHSDLEAGNPLDLSNFSMGAFEATQAGTATQVSILFNLGIPGASIYGSLNIDTMKKLAKAGALSVVIYMQNKPNTSFQTRKVKELRRKSDNGAFYSRLSNGQPFGQTPQNIAFEIELDSPISPSTWGQTTFTQNDNFRIQIFESGKFLLVSPTVKRCYHVYEAQKIRSVGSDVGVSRASDSADKHVLTDAGATFETDLQANLDAGDKIYVMLPYAVVDEDNPDNVTPTAKILVRGILSQTQLQLGLLRKLPASTAVQERQRIGKIPLNTYKIVVERSNSLGLIQDKIKTRVKSPPDGAFSSVNLDVAQLIQPRGVFKLEAGVHFNA